MDARHLEVAALTPQVTEAFLVARRAEGYVLWLSPRALVPLLGYLRRLGAAPQPAAAPMPAAEALLGGYRRYLVTERGLAGTTACGYADMVRPFLAGRDEADGLGLGQLTAAEVTEFVLATCPGMPKGSAKLTATALRSQLGFLHVEGLICEPLGQHVPAVASWRLAGLPRALEPGQVAALLDSCGQCTAVGRRDFAILTLLDRLGLRAGEVAALTLEDIDWRAGEITVRGKGTRCERLPLPADAGGGDQRLLARRPARAVRGCPAGVPARPGAAPGAHRGRVSGAVAPPGSAPGSARFTRTGCGTRQLPACWPLAPR
jgi:integrase/recombinase XerD